MAYLIEMPPEEAAFEFEYKGEVYAVRSVQALSVDEILAYNDALADGQVAALRWLRDFFAAEAPITAAMPSGAFARLSQAWRDHSPEVNPGE